VPRVKLREVTETLRKGVGTDIVLAISHSSLKMCTSFWKIDQNPTQIRADGFRGNVSGLLVHTHQEKPSVLKSS